MSMSAADARWSVVLIALGSLWTTTQAQKAPALPDVLKVAGDAVVQYTQKLGVVAADEEFTQYETSSGRMSTPKRVNSVVVFSGQDDGSLASFRDVVAIDTVPVRSKDDRLPALFKSPTDASIGAARQMTDDAVKAYYSPNLHLLDRPLLALDFLRSANQENSTFKIEGTKTLDGAQVVVLKFNEKGKGGLMPDASAIGRVWIDSGSGVIHQTELGFVSRAANMHATVKFARDAAIDLFMPSELFEQVETSSSAGGMSDMGGGGNLGGRQAMEGRARYSTYRRISSHP
jgi:hypothetical protein